MNTEQPQDDNFPKYTVKITKDPQFARMPFVRSVRSFIQSVRSQHVGVLSIACSYAMWQGVWDDMVRELKFEDEREDCAMLFGVPPVPVLGQCDKLLDRIAFDPETLRAVSCQMINLVDDSGKQTPYAVAAIFNNMEIPQVVFGFWENDLLITETATPAPVPEVATNKPTAHGTFSIGNTTQPYLNAVVFYIREVLTRLGATGAMRFADVVKEIVVTEEFLNQLLIDACAVNYKLPGLGVFIDVLTRKSFAGIPLRIASVTGDKYMKILYKDSLKDTAKDVTEAGAFTYVTAVAGIACMTAGGYVTATRSCNQNRNAVLN